MDIQNEVKVIADAMLEKKGQDVLSLNLSKIGTAISDYFIVCNADSGTNVLSIADNVEDRMIEKCKRKVIRTQGRENALWVILDYGDIVVHVFQPASRDFYRLEQLWEEAPTIDVAAAGIEDPVYSERIKNLLERR